MKTDPVRNPLPIGNMAKPEADNKVDNTIDNRVDSYQEISARAYELYVSRGREEGHDLEDWLQAEMEIAAMKSKSAAA
jgi:Protein of unknown function (DUF2934)